MSMPKAPSPFVARKRFRENKAPSNDDDDDSVMAKCLKFLSEETHKEKDAAAIYGEYVASELRRYNDDDLLQMQAQHAITRCLMQFAEIHMSKNYPNNYSSCSTNKSCNCTYNSYYNPK